MSPDDWVMLYFAIGWSVMFIVIAIILLTEPAPRDRFESSNNGGQNDV